MLEETDNMGIPAPRHDALHMWPVGRLRSTERTVGRQPQDFVVILHPPARKVPQQFRHAAGGTAGAVCGGTEGKGLVVAGIEDMEGHAQLNIYGAGLWKYSRHFSKSV